MSSIRLFCIVMVSAQNLLLAQTAARGGVDPLTPLRFVAGDWTGTDGKGEVRSNGRFSIKSDVGGKILVRRDRAQYIGSDRKTHQLEILVAMAPREDGHSFQANYFDSAGHVLNFVSKRVVPGSLIEFISDPVADPVIFRLVYEKAGPDGLRISFERADAKTPDAFAVVVAGTARRARRGGN